MLKVVIVSGMTARGMSLRHRRHLGKVDLVQFLLTGNILILIGVLIFDLTTQYIFAFFLLIFTANYINFLGYNVLIRRLKTDEGPILKQLTDKYFYSMNALYILNLGAAYSEWFGPWCTPKWLYPACLTACAGLYVINYLYHLYLAKNNYFLKWEKVNPAMEKLV